MAIRLKTKAAMDEARDLVVDSFRQMKDERAQLEEKWKRCLMAYLCEFDKAWADYAKANKRSRRYVGISFDAIETLTPQIYNTIFARDDALKVRPAREGGDIERDDLVAMKMHWLLKHQMRMGKYSTTAKMAIKQLLMLGNCPWTMAWDVRKAVDYGQFGDAMSRWVEEAAAYRLEHDKIMQQHSQIATAAKMRGLPVPPPPQFEPPPEPPRDLDIVFQGPVLRIGSIFNYVEEQHPNEASSAIRIMRSWRTKAYLKKMAKEDETGYRLYENLNSIEDIDSEDLAGDNDAEQLMKSAIGMTLPTGKGKVMVKELHGTFELNAPGSEKGVYENWILTVGNDNTLIRAEPSPVYSGRPMINNARLIKVEGLVYGIGALEKSLDEQDSTNALHNQNIDAVNCVIQPEYEVVQDLLAEGRMGRSGPGARHYVLQTGAIQPIAKNFQGVPLGVEMVNQAIARHERITGAINTGTGRDETATRTQRNTNIIASKLASHAEEVEEDLVNESLNMAMELNAQYLDADQEFAVVQDERTSKVKISPHEIRRGWIVYSAGSRYLAERQERIQNLMMALQMSEQRAASGAPSPVKEHKLWQRMFKEILGEAEDMVMTDGEYQQVLEQHRQMMMQQQMMAAQAKQGAAGGKDKQAEGGQSPVGQGAPAGAFGAAG